MKNPYFWQFAKRMLRRRRLAIGTLGFSVVSAGGLAAGLVALGPLLRLILDDGPDSNLQSAVAKKIAEHSFLTGIVPASLVELLPTDRLAGVAVILGALCVFTVFGAVANFLHQYCSLTLSMATVAELRLEAFRHAVRLPLGVMLRRGPTELATRVTRDANELERGFSALTSKALAQVTKGVGAFLAAVWFDWRLTIVAIVVAPILGVVLRKLGKKISRSSRNTMLAGQDLIRTTNETMLGLRGIKVATGERFARRRFGKANRNVVHADRRARIARALSTPLVELLTVFVIAGLALVAANEILAGRMAFEKFVLTIGALAVAGGSFRPLTGLLNDIQAASAPAERLAALFSMPCEGMRERDLPALPRHAKSIEFDRVSFRYEGAERDAVRDVSIAIRHGEFIAIVGPNGCGKTTLASLIVRLFDPTDGSIRIDGIDVQAASLSSLRRQVGVVSQEPFLVRGTVRENIVLGLEDLSPDALSAGGRQLERALALSHAAQFVHALPQGVDTPLGEGGSGLSGGQRQRLAIARALMRDPALLILDEATSQIDSESEAQIAGAIGDFRKGRTVIAIAHRLMTVRGADRIVVMENGGVVDVGSHVELLGRCSLYQRLVSTQLVG